MTAVIFGAGLLSYGAGGVLHRDINGHRIPPRRHHIGLAIAGAVIAAVLVIAVVTLKKD